MHQKVHLKKVLFSLILVFLIFGCSDTEPELNDVKGYVIFDYQSKDSFPEAKLSVFIETESDVHRAETLKITSKATNYEWTIEEPLTIENDKKQWAGNTNIVCPAGIKIPVGIYEVLYIDAAGDEEVTSFSVYYDEKLLSMRGADFNEDFKDSRQELIALYNDSGTLLYYGMKRNAWRSDKSIFNANRKASYYRIVYIMNENSSVCLLPPVYKDSDKKLSDKQE